MKSKSKRLIVKATLGLSPFILVPVTTVVLIPRESIELQSTGLQRLEDQYTDPIFVVQNITKKRGKYKFRLREVNPNVRTTNPVEVSIFEDSNLLDTFNSNLKSGSKWTQYYELDISKEIKFIFKGITSEGDRYEVTEVINQAELDVDERAFVSVDSFDIDDESYDTYRDGKIKFNASLVDVDDVLAGFVTPAATLYDSNGGLINYIMMDEPSGSWTNAEFSNLAPGNYDLKFFGYYDSQWQEFDSINSILVEQGPEFIEPPTYSPSFDFLAVYAVTDYSLASPSIKGYIEFVGHDLEETDTLVQVRIDKADGSEVIDWTEVLTSENGSNTITHDSLDQGEEYKVSLRLGTEDSTVVSETLQTHNVFDPRIDTVEVVDTSTDSMLVRVNLFEHELYDASTELKYEVKNYYTGSLEVEGTIDMDNPIVNLKDNRPGSSFSPSTPYYVEVFTEDAVNGETQRIKIVGVTDALDYVDPTATFFVELEGENLISWDAEIIDVANRVSSASIKLVDKTNKNVKSVYTFGRNSQTQGNFVIPDHSSLDDYVLFIDVIYDDDLGGKDIYLASEKVNTTMSGLDIVVSNSGEYLAPVNNYRTMYITFMIVSIVLGSVIIVAVGYMLVTHNWKGKYKDTL